MTAKHGRNSPSRGRRDPIETSRFHNNCYANRVPNRQQEDLTAQVRHPRDRGDSPVAFVEECATIDGLALMEWANARLGKAPRLSDP